MDTAWRLGPPEDMRALAEPTGRQLVIWGAFVAVWLVLLVAAGGRLAQRVELDWWLPLALVAGIVGADFLSGVLHWAADTWGRSDMPVLGRRFLVPFRVHHVNPDDFLTRSFLDTNGDVAAMAIPVLAGVLVMPLDTASAHVIGVAGLSLCAVGGMTNQIHQWAHMPSPPRAVRWLQTAGVLLRPEHHAIHHHGPYHAHYCITTGWCNRPLEAIGFFRRMEVAVTRITGVRPREDERMIETRV